MGSRGTFRAVLQRDRHFTSCMVDTVPAIKLMKYFHITISYGETIDASRASRASRLLGYYFYRYRKVKNKYVISWHIYGLGRRSLLTCLKPFFMLLLGLMKHPAVLKPAGLRYATSRDSAGLHHWPDGLNGDSSWNGRPGY